MAPRRTQRRPSPVRSGYRRRSARLAGASRQVTSSPAARARRHARRRHRFRQQWRWARRHLPGSLALPGRLALPKLTRTEPSKLFSLALLVLALAGLWWMQADEAFFVYQEDVRFTGLTYLTPEELYPYGELETWSALWLDPETIRAQFQRHPYVADVQVTIRWPAQVTVQVVEAQPVALWQTAFGERWLLEDGRALEVREAAIQPELVILDPGGDATEPGQPHLAQMRPELLRTALRLGQGLPGLQEFRYERGPGLQFRYPGTATWVQWGNERQFERKWQALERLRSQILAEPSRARLLGLTAPGRPFFRPLDGTG